MSPAATARLAQLSSKTAGADLVPMLILGIVVAIPLIQWPMPGSDVSNKKLMFHPLRYLPSVVAADWYSHSNPLVF